MEVAGWLPVRGRRRGGGMTVGLLLGMAGRVLGGDSKSLLQNLPHEYVTAPWRVFQGENSFSAFTKEAVISKEVRRDETGLESRPAVVKVLARARLPVRALLDTFLSQEPEVVHEWNPFAGEVLHIDRAIQLQTYRLPWPFVSREYLVRCEDVRMGNRGLEAHCASIDDHPSAPLRSDRVRGRSETVWRFSEDKDGTSSIHLETLVDPRGGLPTWIVDKAGKSAAVKIVRALIHHTSKMHHARKTTSSSNSLGYSSNPAAADENVCGARWAGDASSGMWSNFSRRFWCFFSYGVD